VKRKVLFIAVIMLLVSAMGAFSWAIGGAFGLDALGTGLPMGAMLSLKVDQIPCLLGIGFSASTDYFNLGLTADWHFLRENLTGILNYYVGAGAYLGISGSFEIGARIPVALYIFPLKNLELFLELAPAIGIGFNPIDFPAFHIQGAFGFRFWFK